MSLAAATQAVSVTISGSFPTVLQFLDALVVESLESNFRLSNCVHFKLDTLALLYAADDLEQVASVRIAGRTEHPHQALGRLVSQQAQLVEPDGRVDIVAQHGLARIDVTGEQALGARSG